MTQAPPRKAAARPAGRLPVSRPVLWTGIALGAFLAAEAMLHRLVLPLGMPGFVSAAITAVLIVALAVVSAELTRRHHRAAARHAIRHGKRGAAAAARHGGSVRTWLVAKAAARWENRERRPLMFRKLRGEPEGTAAEPAPEAEAPAPGAAPHAPPDDTDGGTTGMTVSKIPPGRRARRTAARTGGSIPSAWAPVIAQTADFEPEDDGQLLEWMGGQVTGLSAWAEALVDFYEHCTAVIGIDPQASAMLHDVADAAAQAAETMGAAKAKFTEHYELPREFAANGGLMTHDGRWVTGEGA
jgi:hypothetical protein